MQCAYNYAMYIGYEQTIDLTDRCMHLNALEFVEKLL